mmetsp:Transcript_41685/g.73177  ORF Transcript_41685/g.73177 Transcript_41685/m.73177 type:complete len:507 (-) Transcript_41685:144-1664(-)
MAGILNGGDGMPLIELRSVDHIEEPTGTSQAIAGCRSRRLAAFVVVALGTVLGTAASVTFFKSSGGAKWASLKSTIGLAAQPESNCPRPPGWCEGEGLQYDYWDCDGDFVKDHYCEGGGYCGCIESSMSCENTWPMVCAYGHDFTDEKKPPKVQKPAGHEDATDVHLPAAASGSGFELISWMTKLNETVQAGQTIATVQPWLPDGHYIAPSEVKADKAGYIVSMQDVEPGAVITGGEALVFVSDKPLGAAPPEVEATPIEIPWKTIAAVIAGLCLLCCIIALLIFLATLCCGKKKEEPQTTRAVSIEEEPKVEEQPLLQEAPPKPIEPKGVPIYFDDEPYYCQYKPLQIKFHQKHPIKVDNFFFNSYGKVLGIQKGQRITRIVDEDVSEERHYKAVEEKLAAALDPLPWWPLLVEFKTIEGDKRSFNFVHRPLGIQFTRHLPIKVEKFKANSYAQDCGVDIHWEITKIADSDVTEEHSFSHVDHNLLEGLKYLPQREAPHPDNNRA